ncbi:primosomal protein N' [Clostridium rectalis]|uniref:primosomal protein N' n=1 Tax=Clostridium rectalis TaxID=2040295 RepID=UPI000F642B3F|nr:primosomal protein N' [Clostridium rectalis]
MYKYAGIIVNSTSIQLDKLFTYEIPEELIGRVQRGNRVLIPFGMGNKKIDGFVIELYSNVEDLKRTKKILNVYDKFPNLTDNDLSLIEKMRVKYLCTYMECIKTIIPSIFFKGTKNRVENFIFIGEKLKGRYDKEPYKSIYHIVNDNNGKYNKTSLSKKFKLSLSSINTMLKHNYLYQSTKIVNRFDQRKYNYYEWKHLNYEQKIAVDSVMNSEESMFLIHGITGSGKTEIYMHLVNEMMKDGKESIILIPEISLTPQMVERFKGRFGKDIAIFHSKLSDGERYDEWLRVKEKKVKLAIGARSAIFLPFENLGLIVIDEEHETSYKSESNPKYIAKEIGEFKTEINGCKLVLGSATPAIDTYYRCIKNEIKLITINKRADGAVLPEINIVDMRDELLNNNKSIFSRSLFKEIKLRLDKNEQIILFLNRRGFSTFVSCRKCGFVFKCKNCDIALTYHSYENNMVCHYCGNKNKITKVCPKCGSKYVKYFGVGTEKVEEEIKKYFPKARTLRMDFDTTRRKNAYENIYNEFKNGRADILVGTQMIAKGLDFKNVTLVGVIAADTSLNIPDFKATERTFQLITQVSGRAGRGEKMGKVIVQTYNPDNYSIVYAANNNYFKFYSEEIQLRHIMNYPPFVELMLINMSSENEQILIKSIQNVGINLKDFLKSNDKIEVLGPCPCEISKIKNNYRWQIIIKGNLDSNLKIKIKNFIYKLIKDVYNDVRISIDSNPISLV